MITFNPRTIVHTLAALVLVPAAFAQFSFTPAGDLAGGIFGSQIRAVDESGMIGVGSGTARSNVVNGGNGDSPVYWTQGGGMVELPSGLNLAASPVNVFMAASDITPDGTIVAGRVRTSTTTPQREAALWTNGGTTLTTLGYIPGAPTGLAGAFAAANALSDDGSVVYGFGTSPGVTLGSQQAFRWDSGGGIVGLGFLDSGDTQSTIAGRGASADGSKAVGSSGSTLFGPGSTAFLYEYGTGMQSLGYLAGGSWSSALGISADGTTIIGIADSGLSANGELFTWTQGGGIVGHGEGFNLTNFAGINGNGTIGVNGNSLFNSQGFSQIDLTLAGAGLNITGWSNFVTFGISDNSNVLWGVAQNSLGDSEGWIATFADGYLANVNTSNVPDSASTALLLLLPFSVMAGCLARRGRKILF